MSLVAYAARFDSPEAYRRWYAERHNIPGGICTKCQQWKDGVDFIHPRAQKAAVGHRYWADIRDICVGCRSQQMYGAHQKRRQKQLENNLTVDLFAAAEALAFPGLDYHQMDEIQRRYCYYIARSWWLDTGFWKHLDDFSIEAERGYMASMRKDLEARGFDCVVPPSPIVQ